jgi:deoxyribodipyrimidine photo-lyase
MDFEQLDINREPLEIIESHFGGLVSGVLGLSSIAGGQSAADRALAQLDITGYARTRSEVYPRSRRGASGLSPYIRHNLLTLPQVYQAVASAPYADREKFRDELLWQEYARHTYARLGTRLFENLRFETQHSNDGDGWNREMRCVDDVVTELEVDGWLVNQTRMWLASHWSVRSEADWRKGQEVMYRHLIDGSRAANLLGWQWTVGAGTGKPYGFARWQVEKRAPGLCPRCPLAHSCPIEQFPDAQEPVSLGTNALLDMDIDLDKSRGPIEPVHNRNPDVVLITIDSMGDADPALRANPDIPVVFVFNREALRRLQLSSQRIGFYLQTLQDLASRRDLQVYTGDPYEFALRASVAVTHAPVPSFAKFSNLAQVHPFPWLRVPHAGSIRSFSSWRRVGRF